jgi:hypothetical protein
MRQVAWTLSLTVCVAVCFVCPLGIAILGDTYGFDRLPSDDDFRIWPLHAIDALFIIELCSTVRLLFMMRGWGWVGAFVVIPMFVVTSMLAVTCGAWVEGTYF